MESKGYEVFLAHDGQAGLEQTRTLKPDLVILDVMMPKMNGYDVSVVLKADPDLNRIPVMGLMTEADDYIAKPVDSAELVKRVEEFLGKA